MRTTMRILIGVLAATLVALLAAGAPAGPANAAVRQSTPAPQAAAGQSAARGLAAEFGRPAAGFGQPAAAGLAAGLGRPAAEGVGQPVAGGSAPAARAGCTDAVRVGSGRLAASGAASAGSGGPAAGGVASVGSDRLPAGVALAGFDRLLASGSAGVEGVAAAGVRFQVGTPVPSPAPSPAPAGPDLNQGNQAADHALVQRRLVLGLVSAVLLLIVYVGRRARNKHTARLKNLQNAKG